MNTERTTIDLGDEYDGVLKSALLQVLAKNNAEGIGESWGVGGSQEIESLNVELGGHLVTIEAETYVGLTISGAKCIVEKLAAEVRAELDSE
jgi:hypothetical protein